MFSWPHSLAESGGPPAWALRRCGRGLGRCWGTRPEEPASRRSKRSEAPNLTQKTRKDGHRLWWCYEAKWRGWAASPDCAWFSKPGDRLLLHGFPLARLLLNPFFADQRHGIFGVKRVTVNGLLSGGTQSDVDAPIVG